MDVAFWDQQTAPASVNHAATPLPAKHVPAAAPPPERDKGPGDSRTAADRATSRSVPDAQLATVWERASHTGVSVASDAQIAASQEHASLAAALAADRATSRSVPDAQLATVWERASHTGVSVASDAQIAASQERASLAAALVAATRPPPERDKLESPDAQSTSVQERVFRTAVAEDAQDDKPFRLLTHDASVQECDSHTAADSPVTPKLAATNLKWDLPVPGARSLWETITALSSPEHQSRIALLTA
jgi:hypothetical protein